MREYGLLPTATATAGGGTPRLDPRLKELDDAVAAAGLSFATASGAASSGVGPQSTGAPSGMTAPTPPGTPAPSDAELQFLDTILRDQVADLIQQLRRYANQYSRVGDCVPLVSQAVDEFGARQYARALSTGYRALTCIRSKLGG